MLRLGAPALLDLDGGDVPPRFSPLAVETLLKLLHPGKEGDICCIGHANDLIPIAFAYLSRKAMAACHMFIGFSDPSRGDVLATVAFFDEHVARNALENTFSEWPVEFLHALKARCVDDPGFAGAPSPPSPPCTTMTSRMWKIKCYSNSFYCFIYIKMASKPIPKPVDPELYLAWLRGGTRKDRFKFAMNQMYGQFGRSDPQTSSLPTFSTTASTAPRSAPQTPRQKRQTPP